MKENTALNDRTITGKHAHNLFAGNVIVRNPDLTTEDKGQPGRWVVTAEPRYYSPYVRVDACDDDTGRDVVWVLQSGQTVVVEVSGRELQLRAAELLTVLIDEDLPEIYSWEITREGVRGMLSGVGGDDQVRAGIAIWRDRIGTDTELVQDEAGGRTRITVSGVLDGVPIRVWTSIRTPVSQDEPAPAAAAATAEQGSEATA